MYCQACSTQNPEDIEYCRHCHQKLLVLSGAFTPEDQEAFDSNPDEQFSFDEHLLERISILEEVVKRTAETVRQVLGNLYKLEQKILVNQTGITSLRDLLEDRRVIGREELGELWESQLDHQLLALEKRERFAAVKGSILALFQGSDRKAFEHLLDGAELALLGFDIEGAVARLDEAHAADPRNHELAFFLGETYFNEEQGERALTCFFRVLDEKPEHYESLVYSGTLCHEQGDSTRAEELLRRAVALFPQAFLPAFSLGAVYAGLGELSKAAAHLERAVSLDPLPQALYLLGSCCYEMGRLGASIRHLRAAVAAEPSFGEAQFLLGLAYLDRRWYRKALVAFRTMQSLHPQRLRFHELAELLGEQGMGEARDIFEQGQVRQALELSRQALLEDPENPALLVAYAMMCLEVDRPQEIEVVIGKVLEQEPGPSERLKATAYATLIEALRSQGRYREGNRLGRRLLSESGSDFSKTLACYEVASNLAEMEEDLDEALSLARRSLELAPEELKRFPLAALGWIHYKRREFTEAVDCLKASNERGFSANTLTHLGMALLASGDRDEARRALVRARSLNERPAALEVKVVECLRSNVRLLQELEGKPKK